MALATIFIHELVQDSQDYGSDDEHMVSRVFFDLELGGIRYDQLHADIKQAVGAPFEGAPLEVSAPHGYTGPFNFQEFRQIVERYYRDRVGAQGHGIRIEGGRNIRMRNNRFRHPHVATFEVLEPTTSW